MMSCIAGLWSPLFAERGEAMTPSIREFYEEYFGAHFADVIIHRSALSDHANRLLSSRAFTIGRHIFFRAGQYAPETDAGRQLLAHELAHVVQKRIHVAKDEQHVSRREDSEREAHAAADAVLREPRFRCIVPTPPMAVSAWGEAGHFYTAHFILLTAGVPYDDAKKVAFYTQMGDEVAELDAHEQGNAFVALSFAYAGAAPPGGGFYISREQIRIAEMQQRAVTIQRGLHCLTGASAANETAWRAAILENAPDNKDNLFLGLATHAFGDSFAHQKMQGGTHMYAAPLGHGEEYIRKYTGKSKLKHGSTAMEFAHAPDRIDERPDLYCKYAEELYAIARYKWQTTADMSVPLAKVRAALDDICSAVGDEEQIFRIRRHCAKLCKPIGPSYFPELHEAVGWDQFRARHNLAEQELTRALELAKEWNLKILGSPPSRKSKVSDYEAEAAPSRNRTHTVAAGESLSAIARQVYGNAERWKDLWDEPSNRSKIGVDPNMIRPGIQLVIPE